MKPTSNQPDSKPTKGYGKRSRGQWILIYVVVAIVVYGVAFVAYKHFHKTTTTDANGNTTTSNSLY